MGEDKMYKMSKELKRVIELFPTQKLFCEKTSIDETVLSNILSERRPIPQPVMISIQEYLGWPFDNLFEAEA